ncbi:MAG: response regulator transcription factor [Pseudomonadota bacterium]
MKIAIIDDHRLFLEAMHRVLRDEFPVVEVLAFQRAGEAFAHLKSESEPDLMLVDLAMPEIDGFGFIDRLNQLKLSVPVVVLSATESLFQVRRALEAGAVGFIPKTLSVEDTVAAIRTVIETGEYLPAQVRSGLRKISNRGEAGVANLSPRQFEVMVLVAKGLSNQAIAKGLGISLATVKSHVQVVLAELGVSNRTQCALRAVKLGLLMPSEIE